MIKKYKNFIYIFTVLAFIIMSIGLTYSYFIYNKEIVVADLSAGSIGIDFVGEKRTITSSNISSSTDGQGMVSTGLDFSVEATADTEEILYEVELAQTGLTTEQLDHVRIYLTDQNDSEVLGIYTYNELINSKKNNGKMLTQRIIEGNPNGTAKTTTNNYRLRIWLDEAGANLTNVNYQFEVYIYAVNIEKDNYHKITFNSNDNRSVYTFKYVESGETYGDFPNISGISKWKLNDDEVTSETSFVGINDIVLNGVKLQTLYNIMKVSSQGTINDFSKTSEEDGTSGVYETVEGTTPIYYYRGAVDNNVKFGDYCWKAIRTTVTGGVKLIYNGEAVGNQCTTQTGTGTMINNVSNIKFNNSSDNVAYVGYTYIDPTTSEETDSNMKQVIDTWYSSAITNNKIDDNKVETTTYCNDRSSRTSGSDIYYGAYDRLRARGSYSVVTPTLNCPNASDNYSLKAGFITADEIAYAGGKYNSSNSTFYLNNNGSYWSGSPYFSNGNALELVVNGGYLTNANVSNTYVVVRSVVSVVPGIAITSGDGTPTNPYIVG